MSGAPDGAWTRLTPVRTRPTRRALVMLVLGAFLYLSGANVSAGWVVVLAGLLLGAVPWAWVQARRAARTVEVRRALPPDAVAGVPVEVSVDVRASSPAVAVVADDLTGATGVAGGLRAGATLVTRLRFRRGRVRGGPVHVHLSDLFGLVEVRVEGEVASPMLVRPPLLPLPPLSLGAAWSTDAGETGRRGGDGAEVVGVRDHQRGDPIRAVHWRATARRGHLVVRELAAPAQARLRFEFAPRGWDAAALDRACEAVCALAAHARAIGHDVTVAVDGEALPWTAAVRDRLAALPPHVGEGPRPLAPPPPDPADVTITLAPGGVGVSVTLTTATDIRPLGVLPGGATADDVRAWLAERLATGAAGSVGGRR